MALPPSPLQESASTYEEYVAARWTALYRTAYLLTANHADAEDLAQATLVKAYLSWGKVTAAASPDAYVRRILTNEFLSSRRPLRVTREHLVDQAPDSPSSRPAPTNAWSCGPTSPPSRPASALSSCCATTRTSPSARSPRPSAARPAP